MLLVLAVGAALGWIMRRVTDQRDAVKAVIDAGGTVRYDFQENLPWGNTGGIPAAPKWLVRRLGIDFFADVTNVVIKKEQNDAIVSHIGRLRRLKRLDLSSAGMTDAGLAQLAGLSELRRLSISGTPRLTDAGLAHLAGLRQLESLSMGESPGIDGPGLAHLAGLDRLRFLNIDIKTDVGLSNLSRLSALRRLWLHMNVTDAALAELARVTWLEDLAFGGDKGSDAKMVELRTLKKLKILQVYGPWFTDGGLAAVAEMPNLSTFYVSDTTSVTPAGLRELRQKRPDLELGVNGSGHVSQAQLATLRNACLPLPTPTGP